MGSRDGPRAREGVSWLGVALRSASFPGIPLPVNCAPQSYVVWELTAWPNCHDSWLVFQGMSR